MATIIDDARLPRFSSNQNGGSHSKNEMGEGSKTTLSERVNALSVYEDAVQEPLLECTNLASMYYQAQQIGSNRPDAKILREDFCSSAIVAQTWLELGKDHRSQGVDIDLKALQIAQKRFMASGREDRTATIIQSSQFSETGKAKKLILSPTTTQNGGRNELSKSIAEMELSNSSDSSSPTSTWAKGAASDRFERRFQARLAKESMKSARKCTTTSNEDKDSITIATGDVMILQHADVLGLPIEGMDEVQIESPDLIYAGNYALSYFHDRKSLLAYLAQCRRTLCKRTGVLIVDPFAGPTNWEVKTEEDKAEQDRLWKQFSSEPGFLRKGEEKIPEPLQGDLLEFWTPPPAPPHSHSSSSDWNQWPRGRLVLVRKGLVNEGEYEYWREDGPLDYTTNRFRMSLSFRFSSDGSWLRDYFSYDFRVWSLREITEAMEEVGFENVSVHAIPRTTEFDRKNKEGETDSISDESLSDDEDNVDDDHGLNGMADLMERTEKLEAEKSTYKVVEAQHKLFATRSFGTYIIACMPFEERE